MSASPDLGAVRPGDVLAGKYRVERVLGVGGMGVVVAATHVQLDEKVALKFLRPDALDAQSRARFLREARAAVKIRSEHVARVTDVGELEDGAPYMVMEYLDGSDLAAWIEERGPMAVEQAVDFVLQACEAIADAHALGIVHRDLKPANLFCTQRTDGGLSIKVLDFGISKVLTQGAPAHDMTGTHALIGSPNYMSPEQMQTSKGIDTRTDLWSLGVILYELLAGEPPFDADTVTELAIMIANDAAPELRARRPDVTAGLAQVIATCLEKDRGKRFQTVGDLAVALKGHGSRSSRLSVERVLGTLRKAGLSKAVLSPTPHEKFLGAPPSVGTVVLPVNVTQTEATWQTAAGSRRPRGARRGLAIGAGLAALVGLGALAVRGSLTAPVGSREPAVATPTPPPPAPLAPEPGAPAGEPPTSLAPASLPPAATPAGPTASAAPRPAPRPSAVASPPAPKPAAPNCTPPYFFDSEGLRHYKPECL